MTFIYVGVKTGVDIKLVWVLAFSYSCVCMCTSKMACLERILCFPGDAII